ncbi:high-affinity phosphodiesterase [Favolaschia claudopus]|uniref:Phosphodiesterase n=1 Tax=Favolaschia claudopus TaxID=2862362 RepID=A0AAW0D1L9_9AGAR
MCAHDRGLLFPPPDTTNTRAARRRSADIGGLSLATRTGGHGGHGWLGHGADEQIQTRFAELLSDMYTQTLNAVNEHTASCESPCLPPESLPRLIAALEGWNFEPSTLPDEDHVAASAVIFFNALFRIQGMEEAVGVGPAQIPPFIHHLRRIYRTQNSYHNFEHALDVLQATYSYLRAADMVPPLSILLDPNPAATWTSPRAFDSGDLVTVLTRVDLFVLAVAAIGHDVGHPGFTNLFMANASAPLSAVFDGQSPLEQLHTALLIRVMRAHGMGPLLDGETEGSRGRGNDSAGGGSEAETGKAHGVRRLLADIVLATDMRVHAPFMERFEGVLPGARDAASGQENAQSGAQIHEEREGESGKKQKTEKQSLAYRRTTLCQGLIKCADISNPSRPYYISKHWAALLLREWNAQAALEKHHQLSVTVEASGEPVREARSQMFFIPAFVKPLLDLVVRGVPEMQPYVMQCDLNLSLWTARLKILQAAGEVAARRSKTEEQNENAKGEGEKEKEQQTTPKGKSESQSDRHRVETTPKGQTPPQSAVTTGNGGGKEEENAEVEGEVEEVEEEDPCPRYQGAFPLALPPPKFGSHFSWATASAVSSPRVPSTSRPPSSFSMAVPPPTSSSSTPPGSPRLEAQARRFSPTPPFSSGGNINGRRRTPSSVSNSSERRTKGVARSRAVSGEFSSDDTADRDGEGEGEETMSEASFTAFSPSSRGSSTTSASPGVRDDVVGRAADVGELGEGDAEDDPEGEGEGEGGSEYGTASEMSSWNPALSMSMSMSMSIMAAEEEDERTDAGTAAIRAAARLAGLKPFGSLRGHKTGPQHRNSWSPAMREEWVARMNAAGVS